AGDRTHIPESALPIYEILSADMQRVKARAPSSFKAQVNDTERRLNILFDHLNNEDLLRPDTIASMVELAQAVQARDYDTAHTIHLEILTNKTDECGNWMVGVKRLIGMSRATP
ncbi:protein transport protein S31, partial [Ascosphaera acerosa]